MITLNQIRELIIKQDKELEEILFSYFSQEKTKNEIVNEFVDDLELQNFTIITLGIDRQDDILKQLKTSNNNIINIIENEDFIHENKYVENGITLCEVNPKKVNDIIEYLLRRSENCIILSSDINKLDSISKLEADFKMIYYADENYHIDKTGFLNNIDIYIEKEVCNKSNIIITENIDIYNYKKIIEKRDNIYLLNENNKEFNIEYIIKNLGSIDDCDIKSDFKEYARVIEDEYEKSKYVIASECDNIQNCIGLAKYIYEKYNTKGIYNIYISLLNQSKDYANLIATAINSEHCEDVYKCELLYLHSLNEYDLINFIINIAIKNYKDIDSMSGENLNYKLALYNFELNMFKIALDKYVEVINNNDSLAKSALVNRNIGYLMYANGNKDYEKYYDYYEEFIKGLDEEECEEIDFKQDDIYDELLNLLDGVLSSDL